MTSIDLAPQAASVARVVAGVRDDQLSDPSPCAGTPVAGILDHLVTLTVAFRMGAEKSPQPDGRLADPAKLPADWRERLPQQLDALGAAREQPSAWEGFTEVGGQSLPGAAMGVIALNEVLVHGWDLAVSTGQPYDVDPAAAQRCLEFTVESAVSAPEMRDAIFGPVVPVPAEAPVFDRLLGQTGRDPAWKP